jgi:predicted DCC family thiol-disulfide oxidoreductase YuxK
MTPALRAACERAAHILKADGTVLRAGRAFLFILEELGWGWIARLLAQPPFIWAVELGYRIVADHRGFFSRFLFRCEN